MEKFLFRPVQLWFVLVLAVLGIIAAIFFASVAMDEASARATFRRGSHGTAGDLAHNIAEVPTTIRSLLFSEAEPRGADHSIRLESRPGGWTRYNDDGEIPGYLLLSRIDGDADRSVIELVDLADFSVKHRWAPIPELL
ncbi:MAG: hypothetical protein WBB85_07175, partial [Albidovulum sp.]|uniref:hypothetical protein n=1 Tax=Albidovulum sp. TaxID=1872424 RepID=UPI003C836F6D